MSIWSRNDRGTGDEPAIDDATAEELVAGRYEGEAPDLVALSQILEQVRSVAREPVPRPSSTLAATMRGSPRVPVFQPAGAGSRRPKAVGVPAVAAAVIAAVAALTLLAGSAHVLPGPTHDVVARIVRTVTPFDFPERREPEAVLSRAPRPEAAVPSERPVRAGDGAPGVEEPGANGNQATGGDPSAGRPPTPAPTTVTPRPTTVPGLAAPTVPTTNGRPSDGVGGTASTVTSSPPAKPGAFTADLLGAPDPQRPGGSVRTGTAALDSNPGRDELCLTLVLSEMTPVTAVHVHAGPVGTNGRVVASFPAPRTPGTSRMCVTVTDQVIKEIRKEPGQYYVDVHTADLVNGTLSGQLTK